MTNLLNERIQAQYAQCDNTKGLCQFNIRVQRLLIRPSNFAQFSTFGGKTCNVICKRLLNLYVQFHSGKYSVIPYIIMEAFCECNQTSGWFKTMKVCIHIPCITYTLQQQKNACAHMLYSGNHKTLKVQVCEQQQIYPQVIIHMCACNQPRFIIYSSSNVVMNTGTTYTCI